MSINWKYSTLNAAEKLKKIQNGDMKLFDNEMANAADYASLLGEAGADTTKAYNYMKMLASAAYSSKGANSSGSQRLTDEATGATVIKSTPKTTRNTNLPKYASGVTDKNMNKALDDLTQAYKNFKDSSVRLESENERLNSYISEWLVNNGYSLDGSLGSEKIGQLDSDYKKQKEEIQKQFRSKGGSAIKFILKK